MKPVPSDSVAPSLTIGKTNLCRLATVSVQVVFLAVSVILAGAYKAAAQLPVITSFSQNGALVCSNLAPGSVASVQWASSLAGPWRTNWTGLDAVIADSNGVVQVGVPMFFRVVGSLAATNSVPPGMVLIPTGTYTMGDTLDGEPDAKPVAVNLSAFFMDANLVSYSVWRDVYTYAIGQGYQFNNPGAAKGLNHPVISVDWFDCVKWCNARSQQAGLVPVYYTDAALTQIYTNGEPATVYPNWSAKGYRLPTEAEWEKGARGGLVGLRFPWGMTISESQANYQGWIEGSSYDLGPDGTNIKYTVGDVPYTSPVGSFAPNGYGLYDMAGNVWEWCWDWYGNLYDGGTDPHGPSLESVFGRVMRGDSWGGHAFGCRSAARDEVPATLQDLALGFRAVLPKGP